MLIGATVLSACGKGGGHAKAPPAAHRALNAGGEPEWSAQVRGGDLHFTAGAGTTSTVKASFADHGRDGLVWEGAIPAADGRPAGPVRLTIRSKPCQDADTGMSYPLSAVLEAPGSRYGGCAAPPGQGLGPRS